MKHNTLPVALATPIMLAAPAVLAWAWNTLAEITAMPPVGYRHAVAVLLLAGAGLALARRRRRLQGSIRHGH